MKILRVNRQDQSLFHRHRRRLAAATWLKERSAQAGRSAFIKAGRQAMGIFTENVETMDNLPMQGLQGTF
jgi:hypothetical protein